MQLLKLFSATIIYAFFLDMLWLGLIAKNIYAANIGPLMRMANGSLAPNWPAAILVYVFITIGIISFVLPRANGDWLSGLAWGALFGAVMYGIYDFTNFSILANWPLPLTLIDFVWGMVLCGMTSAFATFAQRWLSA